MQTHNKLQSKHLQLINFKKFLLKLLKNTFLNVNYVHLEIKEMNVECNIVYNHHHVKDVLMEKVEMTVESSIVNLTKRCLKNTKVNH